MLVFIYYNRPAIPIRTALIFDLWDVLVINDNQNQWRACLGCSFRFFFFAFSQAKLYCTRLPIQYTYEYVLLAAVVVTFIAVFIVVIRGALFSLFVITFLSSDSNNNNHNEHKVLKVVVDANDDNGWLDLISKPVYLSACLSIYLWMWLCASWLFLMLWHV